MIMMLTDWEIADDYSKFKVVRFNEENSTYENLNSIPKVAFYIMSEGIEELELVQ